MPHCGNEFELHYEIDDNFPEQLFICAVLLIKVPDLWTEPDPHDEGYEDEDEGVDGDMQTGSYNIYKSQNELVVELF